MGGVSVDFGNPSPSPHSRVSFSFSLFLSLFVVATLTLSCLVMLAVGGALPQRASITNVGGGYNAPQAPSFQSQMGGGGFPQMGGGFPQQQPMQATYSGGMHARAHTHTALGHPSLAECVCIRVLTMRACLGGAGDAGAGPAIATGPGGYWDNTTITADLLEQHLPDPDDLAHFHNESVFIDSATQRYTLPQNSTSSLARLWSPCSCLTWPRPRFAELELELRHEMMNLRRNPRFYAQILMNEFRPFYQGTALR
jgi:hypothetical protein